MSFSVAQDTQKLFCVRAKKANIIITVGISHNKCTYSTIHVAFAPTKQPPTDTIHKCRLASACSVEGEVKEATASFFIHI